MRNNAKSKSSTHAGARHSSANKLQATGKNQEVKVYGFNACVSLFKSRPQDIIRLYITEELRGQLGYILKWCADKKKAYHICPSDELQKVSGSAHHEDICILAKRKTEITLAAQLKNLAFHKGALALLYLEGVTNPHNLGAIIRVAAYFGIAAIVIEQEEAPTLSGAVHRVAEGGVENLPIIYSKSQTESFKLFRQYGYKIISTVVEGGQNLHSTALASRAVFLFGSESDGLSNKLRHTADQAITIQSSGKVESLNVACAATAVLAEHYRQHRKES